MEVLKRLFGREQTAVGIEASANPSPFEGLSSDDRGSKRPFLNNKLVKIGMHAVTRLAVAAGLLAPFAAVEFIQPIPVKASTEASDSWQKDNEGINRILDNDFGDVLNSDDEGGNEPEEVEVSGNSSPDGFKPESGIIGSGEIIGGILRGEYGNIIGGLIDQVEEVVDTDDSMIVEAEIPANYPQVNKKGIGGYKLTGVISEGGEIIGGILNGEYGSDIRRKIFTFDIDGYGRSVGTTEAGDSGPGVRTNILSKADNLSR